MCRFTSSEYELYRRLSAGPDRSSVRSAPLGWKPGRSLFEWLRDLWRPHRPQVEDAEVVPFPGEAAPRAEQEPERQRSRAA